ncbi:MAG: helix-turn-helix domain-containing protein [Dysgonamonadaceae bacterium]|jgi:AraC-like DNA-binding protein|nr:helix-turn-helix domain-containing protein [Dysgonamonadaceae bacterium]
MNESAENKQQNNNNPQPPSAFELSRIWNSWVFSNSGKTGNFCLPDPVLIFVISGKITLRINERERQTMTSEEMLALTSSTDFRVEVRKQAHVVICQMPVTTMFTDKKVVSELLSLNVAEPTEFNKMNIHKTITRFLLLLVYYLNDGLVSEHLYGIKRHELFMLLINYYDKTELARFFNQFLTNDSAFKIAVLNNYRKVKNIKELAALLNYSVSGFIKKFKSNFNESPYRWIQKQKAQMILIDINKGEKSLQAIAIDYEFSSYQHFSLFCQRNFKMSPTQIYRKNLLENVFFK